MQAAAVGTVLLTAGCFRPAGESASATPEGAVDAAVVIPADTGGGADTAGLSADPVVPTVDSLLTVLPTAGAATASPFMEQVGTLPDPNASGGSTGGAAITLIPLGSGAATPTPMPVIVTLANITPAPAFITPGAPLAPITLEPGAPFPGDAGASGSAATSTPSGLITPTSLPGTGDDCLYIVQPGDSLYQISLNEDVTLEALRAANPDLSGEAPILQIGQQINLPGCGPTPEAEAGGSAATPTTAGSLTSGANTTTSAGEEYVVQPGDTLYAIALRNGVTVQEIINANVDRLADPNRLQVGDRLIIPSSGN